MIPRLLAATILLLGTSTAYATTACPGHFANGQPPGYAAAASQTLFPICLEAGAVLFSGARLTPVWTAERLTRASLDEARRVSRNDAFHEEPSLPVAVRTYPDEFKNSCFDRGHNIPSANAPSTSAQRSTFSMANISPQDPTSNQTVWEGIETAARIFAKARGDVYVVTGPLYLSTQTELLNRRIAVPTHFYKAVLDPRTGEAGAYISSNSAAQTYDIVSIDFLTRLSGIDPFPAMNRAMRAKAADLPRPGKARFIPRPLPAACTRNADGTLASGAVQSPRAFQPFTGVQSALGTAARQALRILN